MIGSQEYYFISMVPLHNWVYQLGRLWMIIFQTVGLGRPDHPLRFHFSLGYIKTKVFKSDVKDIDDLKTKIIEAVASVRPETLVKTWKEVKSRLEMLAENGNVMLKDDFIFFYQMFVAYLIIKRYKYFFQKQIMCC